MHGGGDPADGRVAPITWYSRRALDQYLAEAATERARLQASIDDANGRRARASAAVGLHQTMLEMLLESQREIADIRRAAEIEAARVMAEGDREADALFGAHRVAGERVAGNGSASPVAVATAVAPSSAEAIPPADDEFFSYLKDALTGDEPLGPAPQ